MALGPLHTEINSITVSTKSKGTSSAESTYQTDVRWRCAAMRREGLRAESKHITPRSVKTREALLWSKGLGVGNWQTKTFLSLSMMVRFPGLNWHRRAKVPLQNKQIFLKTRKWISVLLSYNSNRIRLEVLSQHFCVKKSMLTNSQTLQICYT